MQNQIPTAGLKEETFDSPGLPTYKGFLISPGGISGIWFLKDTCMDERTKRQQIRHTKKETDPFNRSNNNNNNEEL